MKLENAIVDLMVRAGADNVIVDSGSNETLATRLATIASQLVLSKKAPVVLVAQVLTKKLYKALLTLLSPL